MDFAPTDADWADAVATRIASEWSSMGGFAEDYALLRDVLRELFTLHPEHCQRLVGTGVIEDTYFEPLP